MIVEKKTYPLMPEGQHNVTISEVKDLGERDTAFGKKHQIVVEFKNAAGDSIGKVYTPSVHEKANLYKDVRAFTGKAPSSPFDTDSLVGQKLTIVVTHEPNQQGELKARIVAFLKSGLPRAAVAEDSGIPA